MMSSGILRSVIEYWLPLRFFNLQDAAMRGEGAVCGQ